MFTSRKYKRNILDDNIVFLSEITLHILLQAEEVQYHKYQNARGAISSYRYSSVKSRK